MLSCNYHCHPSRLVLPSYDDYMLCYRHTYSIYKHNHYNGLCIYHPNQRSDLNSYRDLEIGCIHYPKDNGEAYGNGRADKDGETDIFYHSYRGDNYHHDNYSCFALDQADHYVLPLQGYDHEFVWLSHYDNSLEEDNLYFHNQDSNHDSDDNYNDHERSRPNHLHDD